MFARCWIRTLCAVRSLSKRMPRFIYFLLFTFFFFTFAADRIFVSCVPKGGVDAGGRGFLVGVVVAVLCYSKYTGVHTTCLTRGSEKWSGAACPLLVVSRSDPTCALHGHRLSSFSFSCLYITLSSINSSSTYAGSLCSNFNFDCSRERPKPLNMPPTFLRTSRPYS